MSHHNIVYISFDINQQSRRKYIHEHRKMSNFPIVKVDEKIKLDFSVFLRRLGKFNLAHAAQGTYYSGRNRKIDAKSGNISAVICYP